MQIHEAEPKASPKQKARLMLARLGIGPYYASIGVRAEILDKHHGITDEPSARSMVELINRIDNADSMEERYKILTEPVPYPKGISKQDKPELWFDYIDWMTSEDIVQAINKTASSLLSEGKPTWNNAIDLGAGIGYLGANLIGKNDSPRVAESVTLVDLSPTLLKVAEKRYGPEMKQVVADVTKLPFDDETFDLVTSAGLIYSLGPEMQAPFFKEVSRILSPGGVYLDGDYLGPYRHSKARTVPRFQLETIVQMSAALETPFNPLFEVEDKTAYFEQFGLKLSYRDYVDEQTKNTIQIRILEKPDQTTEH